MMGYLKLIHNCRLVLDISYPEIEQSNFKECVWADFSEGAIKLSSSPLPPKVFRDSDKWTRKSRNGSVICMNLSLIHLCSKKQLTIKTSVFGLEISVMKVEMVILHAIKDKLRMTGIPLLGPHIHIEITYQLSNQYQHLQSKNNN